MVDLSPHHLGAFIALLGALLISVQYIFVRLATQHGTVPEVILVSLVCNVVIVLPPALIWSSFSMGLEAVAYFVAAGIVGSLVARICIFKSIHLIGASRTSPIVSANALFAVILAVLILDETLTAIHFAGVIMIVGGITLVTRETAENTSRDLDRKEFLTLLALPLAAAMLISFEPIFISLGLSSGAEILPGIAIMVGAACIGYIAYLATINELPSIDLVTKPYAKWYLGAGITTTAGFLAYFAALELAPVSVVVPLLQTTPLLTALLAAILLPTTLERVTKPVVIGAAIVVLGAALVTAFG